MKPILQNILDWVYPPGCACCLCGEEARTDHRGLCPGCAARMLPAGKRELPGVDGAVFACTYTPELAASIHRFKYNDQRWLCGFFAGLLELPGEWNIDVIAPVPLHPKKRRKRGYNQSALLARELEKRWNIPVDEGLVQRLRDTGTQTKLAAQARMENMAGAFAASPAAKGRNILLLDDVCTTGATLVNCAQALKSAGAEKVFGAAICSAELDISKES